MRPTSLSQFEGRRPRELLGLVVLAHEYVPSWPGAEGLCENTGLPEPGGHASAVRRPNAKDSLAPFDLDDLPLATATKGAFPISRSRAHTHRRHGHPLQNSFHLPDL